MEKRVVLPVGGLHCASCVSRVEKAVGAVGGVASVSVDLSSATVSVAGEFGRDGLADVRRAIEGAGYRVLEHESGLGLAESAGRKAVELEARRLLERLVGAGLLSLPLMASGYLSLSPYTQLLIAIPLQVWGGWHFHQGFLASLTRRSADMNTLVSLSTWAAFLYSAVVALGPELLPPSARVPQWDAVTGLLTFVTFGRWLEARTRSRTSEAVSKLMLMSPRTVRVLREGRETTVPVDEAGIGEVFRVRPGEQVGLDGLVVGGASLVDESLLTGESLPVEKSPGSLVWGGTLNKMGALEVKVTKPAGESALSRLVEAVRHSLAAKPRVQQVVDSVAAAFVPAVLLVGVVSAVLWAIYGPEPRSVFALTAFVSVLACACPCALGLATPLALIAGIGRAAEMGVFIRNADVIERVSDLDCVLFDKTGTLTEGKPRVSRALPLEGEESEVLALALGACERSEHPYAQALADYARSRGVASSPVDSFESFPGRGVSARGSGMTVRVGSLEWLRESGCVAPSERLAPLRKLQGALVGVCADSELRGVFALSDALRASAPQAVADLKAMGLEVILLSGDRNAAAYRAAEEAGIATVFAEVLPEEKARIVARLKSEGKTVAMVGEGFNDAPALSGADVGIALASGTDIAVEAADLALLRPDLSILAEAFELCRRIRRVIRQNLFWAFIYNIVLIPIAAGALYPAFGIMLKPHYAAGAMALSSVSVALNSLRLRKRK